MLNMTKTMGSAPPPPEIADGLFYFLPIGQFGDTMVWAKAAVFFLLERIRTTEIKAWASCKKYYSWVPVSILLCCYLAYCTISATVNEMLRQVAAS
jgi:hypothetical protein